MTTAPVKAGPFLRSQALNTRAPGWLRLTFWCWGHADLTGHARADSGQLQQDLALHSSIEVSRVIQRARERGLIHPSSSSACLVLPGCALAGCDARHREGS